jgi:hypothetical protein
MQPTEVEVVFDPATGETTYEVKGMPGTGCTDLTNALTQGKKVLEQELTCEYYTPAERPDYIDSGTNGGEE